MIWEFSAGFESFGNRLRRLWRAFLVPENPRGNSRRDFRKAKIRPEIPVRHFGNREILAGIPGEIFRKKKLLQEFPEGFLARKHPSRNYGADFRKPKMAPGIPGRIFGVAKAGKEFPARVRSVQNRDTEFRAGFSGGPGWREDSPAGLGSPTAGGQDEGPASTSRRRSQFSTGRLDSSWKRQWERRLQNPARSAVVLNRSVPPWP